jgi:hypothetical protein
VAVVVASFAVYVVAPGLVTVLGAWPGLEDVRPLWFVVLAALEIASFVALWVLLHVSMPRARWRDPGASQLVGNTISKVLPGGAATCTVVQGRMLVVAGSPGPEAQRVGDYPNFVMKPTDASDFFDAETWERLRRVKAAYDPSDVFRGNHQVPPDAS